MKRFRDKKFDKLVTRTFPIEEGWIVEKEFTNTMKVMKSGFTFIVGNRLDLEESYMDGKDSNYQYKYDAIYDDEEDTGVIGLSMNANEDSIDKIKSCIEYKLKELTVKRI